MSVITGENKKNRKRKDPLWGSGVQTMSFLELQPTQDTLINSLINDSIGRTKDIVRFSHYINDLDSFRNHKHIFIWIAIISSLVFGAIHVITGSIFTSTMAFGLAVLKTLSAGVCGVCWLLMYWKTRNLWGIALLHALCDFPTFLQSALTEVNVSLGGAENYTGAGVAGLAVYLVQIVCNVIAFIILWKKVGKTIDFEDIRRNW